MRLCPNSQDYRSWQGWNLTGPGKAADQQSGGLQGKMNWRQTQKAMGDLGSQEPTGDSRSYKQWAT